MITRMILGGAQENTLYTLLGLRDRCGCDVRLLTGPAEGPEGELLARARAGNLDVVVIPELGREIAPVRDASSLRRIAREIRRFRPGIVHTHSSKAGILGRFAAREERVRLIVHTIHGLPFHPYERSFLNALYVALERRAARFTHLLISVADAMTEKALAAGVGRRGQFVTVRSGMEVESFLAPGVSKAEARKEFGLPAGGLVVGKIARLAALKGHEHVIEAASRLGEEYHFFFVGDGARRRELERLAERKGVRARVTFAGLVDPFRIPRAIRAMDVLVHASLREGLARALPQALIGGVPAVSFDVDGAREVVRDGETGFLVEPGDSAGLARALRTLGSDERLRTRMGEEGRRLAEEFRWEGMADRVHEAYLRALARAGRGCAVGA